jgi:type IV pilus assembly protein PilO
MLEHDIDRKLTTLGWCLHGAAFAIALLVAVSIYGLVLRPLKQNTESAERRVETLEASLAEADALQAEYERLSQQVANCNRRAARLARRVPTEPQEAEFLSELQAAASRAGLQIRNYHPGVSSQRDGHSQLEIQLTCVAKYPNVCRFLERLGNMDRLSRITQMEINGGGADGYPIALTMSVFFDLKLTPVAAATTPRPGDGRNG